MHTSLKLKFDKKRYESFKIYNIQFQNIRLDPHKVDTIHKEISLGKEDGKSL